MIKLDTSVVPAEAFQQWYDSLPLTIPHGHVAQMRMAWEAALAAAPKQDAREAALEDKMSSIIKALTSAKDCIFGLGSGTQGWAWEEVLDEIEEVIRALRNNAAPQVEAGLHTSAPILTGEAQKPAGAAPSAAVVELARELREILQRYSDKI